MTSNNNQFEFYLITSKHSKNWELHDNNGDFSIPLKTWTQRRGLYNYLLKEHPSYSNHELQAIVKDALNNDQGCFKLRNGSAKDETPSVVNQDYVDTLEAENAQLKVENEHLKLAISRLKVHLKTKHEAEEEVDVSNSKPADVVIEPTPDVVIPRKAPLDETRFMTSFSTTPVLNQVVLHFVKDVLEVIETEKRDERVTTKAEELQRVLDEMTKESEGGWVDEEEEEEQQQEQEQEQQQEQQQHDEVIKSVLSDVVEKIAEHQRVLDEVVKESGRGWDSDESDEEEEEEEQQQQQQQEQEEDVVEEAKAEAEVYSGDCTNCVGIKFIDTLDQTEIILLKTPREAEEVGLLIHPTTFMKFGHYTEWVDENIPEKYKNDDDEILDPETNQPLLEYVITKADEFINGTYIEGNYTHDDDLGLVDTSHRQVKEYWD